MPRRSSLPSTYNEPTVMWRLQHPDGRWAHGVIAPRKQAASAMYFVNGALRQIEDFESWAAALDWIEQRQHNLELWEWRSIE